MTAPPRPLDDLTRDLRARTIEESSKAMGLGVRWPEAYKPLIDPLTLEAADAIDRLRAELQRYGSVVHGYAAMTGALPGDNVFKHYARVSGDASINDAIKSTANLYLANVGEHRAGKALAGLYRIVADAGYQMLTSSEVEELRAEKADLATKTVKSALAAFRPILKHHFVRDYIAPGGNIDCACGVRVRTIADHVDHVLNILAFGAEPPKDPLLKWAAGWR